MTLQPSYVKFGLIGIAAIAIFFAGYSTRNLTAKVETLQVENKALVNAAEAAEEYQRKVDVRDAENKALQTQLTTLDKEHLNARTEALTTNAALRGDLAVAQRMRLQGASCPKGSASGVATSAAGLGDGAQVELSEQTRLAVFDLRESIIGDETALEGCKAYVRALGLYPGG